MARILLTGGTGFIGSHLLRILLAEGHQVTATRFEGQTKAPWPWSEQSEACTVSLDVRDRAAVFELVGRVRPDEVYHLAAQSLPTLSWQFPEETLSINVLGTVHVFEALKASGLKPRTFVACSSAAYGLVPPEQTPVHEDRILQPVHPYGVSKAACDQLCYQYWRNDKIPAIRGRIFNTTGPGKSQDAPGDFAERIVDAERRGLRSVRVGNLEPRRDLSDVRDQCRAILAITRQGEPGEAYNLSTGRTLAIRELAEVFRAKSTAELSFDVDPALLRPTDEPVIWGDNRKLVAATGYEPQIPLERTVEDMLKQLRGERVALN